MSEPVSRRASLPGASELFRATEPERKAKATSGERPAAEAQGPKDTADPADRSEIPAATGRVRHDKKITVYFSSDELFALEDATLELKRHYGLSLDRGRLVRTAVALALADLAEHGEGSAVVGELRAQ